MEQRILKAGSDCIQRLEEAGFSAYFVGGCVRDLLLQQKIHDVDVATSARPHQVLALFEHAIPTGLSHGTVTVLLDSIPVEVTTFRRESGYSDHRHPDAVYFVDRIEEDLARRDFTINALAMTLDREIIDPFQGEKDLKEQILRGVGDPVIRFNEDPLRMLRGIRFAVQLGFTIEKNTYEGIKKCAPSIQYIAMERILVEWNKALMSKTPQKALAMLYDTKLYEYIPGLNLLVKGYASYLGTDEHLQDLPLLAQRLAYLLYKGNLVNEALMIMKELKYDRKTTIQVKQLLDIVQRLYKTWDAKGLMEIFLSYTGEVGLQAVAVYELLAQKLLLKEAVDVYNKMTVKQLKNLAMNGKELLQSLERPPGPWIHNTLTQLALEVNLQLLPNEKNTLIERARRINYDNT
jgi:tRNA nucleotidyltransferase (CCA-adding enzyme)